VSTYIYGSKAAALQCQIKISERHYDLEKDIDVVVDKFLGNWKSVYKTQAHGDPPAEMVWAEIW
jgi:hypothetical protein